jgi:methylphosphotriester-DNA--protein-cysteine methyltransferase
MMQKDNYFGVLRLVVQGEICFAGNKRLKIYGKITCGSGKRMKKENRVFFASEKEAVEKGYRPCGHCMRQQYSSQPTAKK